MTMAETACMWKLNADPVIKPWGLKHGGALSETGIRVGLGELWLASAQVGEGNYASSIVDPPLGRNLNELLADAADRDEPALRAMLGERALNIFRNNPHRGKTEAWLVRNAAGRAGFAAGPRTPEQCQELKELLTGPGLSPDIEEWSPEVRELFGIIAPVEAGEVYMVPAGTLHTMFAIGEESHLIVDEIQQGYGTSWLPTLSKILMVQDSLLSVQVHPTDATVRKVAEGGKDIDQNLEENPTVRVYDFGRRPGEYPELGFELTDTEAGLCSVEPVQIQRSDAVRFRMMVVCDYFAKKQLRLEPAGQVDLAPYMDSYHVIHCTSGSARLTAQDNEMEIERGETVFIPASLERDTRIKTMVGCSLFDDFVPAVPALEEYLLEGEATQSRVEALLNPPRALEE